MPSSSEQLQHSNIISGIILKRFSSFISSQLKHDIEDSILEIKEVNKVDLDLVWEPPWDKSMMSEAAKLELNL